MLNRSASLAMSTSVLKALPGKLDIKRHSPSILYLLNRKAAVSLNGCSSGANPGFLDRGFKFTKGVFNFLILPDY